MPFKPTKNRRASERRVDKITMKARTMVGTLKRTIGPSAARRFLEQNGYAHEVVEGMMLSSVERRCSRRRTDGGPIRVPVKKANIRMTRKDETVGSLSAKDINELYRLRVANDSEGVFIRVCDCPPQFARFGFMEPGLQGARITERGRATLLHWTRAKALLAVSRGQGIDAIEDSVATWLTSNRFIEISVTNVVITSRGTEWLNTRLVTLEKLD